MLNKVSVFIAAIMMTALLIGGARTAQAELNSGYFDEFEGDTIVGWGWDCSMPNTSVPIHITVSDHETSQVVREFHPTAAIYRDDLKENGIGNGRHGFRVSMDWDSLPDGLYTIEGDVDGKKFANIKTYAKGDVPGAQDAAHSETVSSNGLRSIGLFKTTGYCSCYKCSKGWGKRTSTGTIARSNHTIAVDPRVIPYGTQVMINGIIYTAEDKGSSVKGNHIDIYFDTHSQGIQHGCRMQEVFLIQ